MSEQLRIEHGGQVIIAPDWAGVTSLAAKLATALAAVQPVEKDGRNEFYKYNYVSYEMTSATIRKALATAKLAFAASIEDVADVATRQTSKGGEERILRVTVALSFLDSETGSVMYVRMVGEGTDASDKAINKALTSAVKYGLMRMFLTSTQEDTDADPDADRTEQATTTQTPRATSGKPAKHWVDDATVRANFWGRTSALGANEGQVHEALGVEHVREYQGTVGDALTAIQAYMAERKAPPEPQAENAWNEEDQMTFRRFKKKHNLATEDVLSKLGLKPSQRISDYGHGLVVVCGVLLGLSLEEIANILSNAGTASAQEVIERLETKATADAMARG